MYLSTTCSCDIPDNGRKWHRGESNQQRHGGRMDRQREVSNVGFTLCPFPLRQLSPRLHLAQLSYLDAEVLRAGPALVMKSVAHFARRVHASTYKWAAALAFDILRATQGLRNVKMWRRVQAFCSELDRSATRVRTLCVFGSRALVCNFTQR